MLDYGLYQGSPREAKERNASFDFDPTKLDAVILSHAHTDHCGNLPNLPNLVKQGFSAPIFCTPVTGHLADLLMQDSGKIQELEADEAAEEDEALENSEEVVEPIYTREEAQQVFLVHGEDQVGQVLQEMPQEKGMDKVITPTCAR